jgi:hypothetical protein
VHVEQYDVRLGIADDADGLVDVAGLADDLDAVAGVGRRQLRAHTAADESVVVDQHDPRHVVPFPPAEHP